MRFMNLKKYFFPIIFFAIVLLTSSCEKQVSTSPPEPEAPKGFIFVDSNPDNYKIYLDGRFTGRFTPDTLLFVEETEHLIELKRKYWLDTSSITVAEHEVTKSLFIDLLQNPKVYGSLNLQSKPDSAIAEINDSLTTIRTPYQLGGLLPGVYNVKYHLANHRSSMARTIVQSNKITTINLALQDTSIWVDFTTKNSMLPSNNITTIALDQDNRLWVGTANKGIVVIRGESWQIINTSNANLPSDNITTIEVDKNNAVWIGTDKGLVEYRNNVVQQVYDHTNSAIKGNDKIFAIDFYRDDVFAGTSQGLLKIRYGESELYEVENNGLSIVTSLEADEQKDELWVGVVGGLLKLDFRDGDLYYNPKRQNIGASVDVLHLVKMKIRPADGKLWALFSSVSGQGQSGDLLLLPSYITVWTGEKWLFQKLEPGSKNLFLTDITVDRDNVVWITTNKGLRKHITLRDGEIQRAYNTGLFNDELTAIKEDENGALWIGSEYGLFKYKKDLDTQ